jgi:enoyl-CoA hydratase/carnithine racemase
VSSDRVSCTVVDGVADVRMTRADKMNALDPAMFAALVETGEALKADRSVRAVVLSGDGRAFCAGLDFSGFQAMAGGPRERGATDAIGETAGRITHTGQQAAWVWQELPVPVIAAVHGVAYGGGIQIALGADLRIVHPDAKLSVLEIRWGLTPDMTGIARLGQLVRPDVALELAVTGRVVDGREAAALGLATKVSETPLDDALALAREIAAKSPHAVRGAKHLVRLAAGGAPVAEVFAEERRVIGSLIGTPNQVESVTAYFEKRDPVYRDVD